MKIKNRRWHKKRYFKNRMNTFILVHDKRPHRKVFFKSINDINLWLENHQNSSLQ